LSIQNTLKHIRTPGLTFKVLWTILSLFALAISINIFNIISDQKTFLSEQMDREGKGLAQASAIFATEALLIEDYPVLNTYASGVINHYPELVQIEIKRKDQVTVAKIKKKDKSSSEINAYFADVTVNGEVIGNVTLNISTSKQNMILRQQLTTLILESSLIFLILALILFIAFRKMITEPLLQLSKQTIPLSKGDLNTPIKISKKGELLQLADVLNSMRINLKRSYDEIQHNNQQLDKRVAERTKELQLANQKIVETHQQLLQSEKMAAIGQLSAGVAHEINNPIGFINSNITVLNDWFDQLFQLIDSYENTLLDITKNKPMIDQLKAKHDFLYIQQEIPDLMQETIEGLNRVKAIISDLKNFAHVDDQKWQKTDLNMHLHSTLNIVRNEVKYKATLELDLKEISKVECRPSQINQVFMNIIVNAAQAIQNKGKIRISNKENDDWVCFSISDTGQGIKPEDFDHIMEPFYTTKPVGIGTGLGLSVSYGIIHSHNGKIDVETEQGLGTTFHIWLPKKQPQVDFPSQNNLAAL